MSVLTKAFTVAAAIRGRVLGIPDHPMVVLDHPLASKTRAEMEAAAESFVDSIAKALAVKP